MTFETFIQIIRTTSVRLPIGAFQNVHNMHAVFISPSRTVGLRHAVATALADIVRRSSLRRAKSEWVRFELTVGCPTLVFKTSALDLSATLPSLLYHSTFIYACKT